MVKKQGILIIFLALFMFIHLNTILAINLDVSSSAIQDTFIQELKEPTVYDLTITNKGNSDSFEIYSLIGMDISPKNFDLNAGETKTITLQVTPQKALASKTGYSTFEYKIRDSKKDIQIESLLMNIIEFKDAFSVGVENINPKSTTITLTLKNEINKDFSDLKIKSDSAFFSYEDKFLLKALEEKEIGVPLDIEKLRKLTAGSYLLNTNIEFLKIEGDIETIIKFLEQEDIETNQVNEGLLIKRFEITKTNVGNTIKTVNASIEKNLISVLFTTFNIVPTEKQINGLHIKYTWTKELIPNEEFNLVVKTNWFYPILILILAIGLYLLIKNYVESDLILKKKVSYVKTTGGEFALKISLKAKAKKYIERINIVDKLPPLVELYGRYGTISPDKVDLKNKRMEWNIESLNEREERIFSYIIYSKIGVVGQFELPKARAMYEKSGKIKQVESNRSFFINQPKS